MTQELITSRLNQLRQLRTRCREQGQSETNLELIGIMESLFTHLLTPQTQTPTDKGPTDEPQDADGTEGHSNPEA